MPQNAFSWDVLLFWHNRTRNAARKKLMPQANTWNPCWVLFLITTVFDCPRSGQRELWGQGRNASMPSGNGLRQACFERNACLQKVQRQEQMAAMGTLRHFARFACTEDLNMGFLKPKLCLGHGVVFKERSKNSLFVLAATFGWSKAMQGNVKNTGVLYLNIGRSRPYLAQQDGDKVGRFIEQQANKKLCACSLQLLLCSSHKRAEAPQCFFFRILFRTKGIVRSPGKLVVAPKTCAQFAESKRPTKNKRASEQNKDGRLVYF
jgi:hypothetical protein